MRSAGVGCEVQSRCEKGQTTAERLLGVNREYSLCVSLSFKSADCELLNDVRVCMHAAPWP